MSHPIIDKIVNEGPQSINVSALSPELKKNLLTQAANTLLARNKFEEAAETLFIGGNTEMLKEQGEWFLKQQKPGIAAFFLLHIQDDETLRRLAEQCVGMRHIHAAKAVYKKLNDPIMAQFLEENFPRE